MNLRLPGCLILLAALLPAVSPGALPVKELWSTRRPDGGPYSSYPRSHSEAVDAAGNVFVAGSRFVNRTYHIQSFVAKHAAADGARLWEIPTAPYYTDTAMAADRDGNLVVSSGFAYAVGDFGHFVFSTTKYAAADGAILWEKRSEYNSSYGDLTTTQVMDQAGDVIVSYLDNPTPRHITKKYAGADGRLLWTMREKSNLHALDPHSHLITVGNNQIEFNVSDIYRYDPFAAKVATATGAALWRNELVNENNEFIPTAVAANPGGAMAITGYIQQYLFQKGLYTVKLAPNGKTAWRKLFPGPIHNNYTGGVGTVVDSDGNVIVAGHIGPYAYYHQGFYTYAAKYAAANGATLWERQIKRPELVDTPEPIVVLDGANHPVLICAHPRPNDLPHILTTKLAADGTPLWRELYDGQPGDRQTYPHHAIAGPGFVLVTGIAEKAPVGPGNGLDPNRFILIKYVDGATPQTFPADGIAVTGATLHAKVNPNRFSTHATFEYSTDPNLTGASALPPVPIGKGNAAVPVAGSLTGLNPVTTYYYRAVAIANSQATRGEIRQFTTPPRQD